MSRARWVIVVSFIFFRTAPVKLADESAIRHDCHGGPQNVSFDVDDRDWGSTRGLVTRTRTSTIFL
jgi:hypothetical protein